jgi:hypothetical protein
MVDVVEKEGYGWNPIETAVPLQEKTITNGTTIIYELDEYVLNGNSERYNESEVIDGVEEYFKECDYAFLVKKSLGNEWQNSKITLQLLVQAKQYRNSGDWGDVHTETIEIGGSEKDVVPDETIITNQGTVYMVDGVTFASLIRY